MTTDQEARYIAATDHERNCARACQEIRASISHMESTMIIMRRALDEALKAEKEAIAAAVLTYT